MQFKTEVNELLQLMIHSLYSNKEIFLRELISNASDACDKRSLARAKGQDASNDELEIKISTNEDAKLLIIEDSGCGMSAAELEQNLGTIAHSGTKAYMKEQAEKGGAASELIGQFGVGFYSAFMVADKIEVYSKATHASEANCWSSDANGYEITPCEKESVGTKIVLHCKDAEYCNDSRIEYLIKKYSKHINYAIKLEKAVLGEDGKPSGAKAYEQINSAKAIWKENKSALKNEDYEAFFADLSYGDKPLGWVHTNSEGSLEYNSLFFVPSIAPRDLMQMDYEKGCKLYVKRVLISEKEDLLPIYLRFIKGVVDVADLDLNVSREILQDNAKIKKISELSAKKVLGIIANFEGEKRQKFNEQFGAVIKEGLLDPNAPHEAIYQALDFSSSCGKINLETYIKDHADAEKKEIYFLQGDNLAVLEQNALISNYPCVIFLADRVDEFTSASLPEYKGYKWINIAEAQIEAGCEGDEQKALASALKTVLDAKVREVKFSSKLGDKLSAILYDSQDQAYQMSKMMAKFGGAPANFVGDLLLNSEHELIKKALKNPKNEEANKFLAQLLFASANLSNQTSQEDAQALAAAAVYFANHSYEA